MVADPRELGAVIRRMRLASGLSQEQLAERSGLSVRAVSDLERGQRSTPRPETIRMLADGMHLSRQDRQELLFAARPELRPSATPQGSDPLILHRLPETPSQLIGRERDVASLVSLMTSGNQPLTTLTGPGGVGKTRLAVEAAHQAAQFFSAVVFVDLAAVSVPEQVASAIAQSMGIQEAGDQSIQDTLVSALRNRQMLLVLDNFEQVIAAAEMVGELLFRLPNLRVVVTSREALRIRAEYELPVEPLELPEDQNVEHLDQLSKSSAVAMFVAAAQSVNDDFDLNQENARAIASICRRLDGLPLAIELAGSRVRHFPPTVLLERLERSLPVLTGGARDAPVRQRTLRNTIAWSFDLLTP
ncbi:MAG: helix-turn-helix domain-containing protein, partial [Thermomicrobiales bacterium]